MTTTSRPQSDKERYPQVRIPKDLYDELSPMRGPGESIADVMRRLLRELRDAERPVVS